MESSLYSPRKGAKVEKVSLNGLLLVDKPKEWSSHDVVSKVRRLLHMSSVGHSGTLDPFASGLMVILLGHGTKISDYILSKDKTYEVVVRFGVETDTLDRTGTITQEKPVEISEENLRQALLKCQGEVDLEVPMFSAVKIKGKKLYDYAREGKKIEAPLKSMHFYDVKLLDFKEGRLAHVRLSCSKGSYIRAWAAWMGRELGCGAIAEELRRTSSAPFTVEKAISIGHLEALSLGEEKGELKESLKECYIPLAEALPDVKRLNVSAWDEKLLVNGQISKEISARLISEQKEALKREQNLPIQVFSAESGRLLALIEAQAGKGLKIRRVFKGLN